MAAPASPEVIETALREALPPEYRDRARDLARALLAASAHPDRAAPSVNPALHPLLRNLAGTDIRAGQALISFDGAQRGAGAHPSTAGGRNNDR